MEEGNGLGFIALIVVWGGLFYLIFFTPLISGTSGNHFLASALSSFSRVSDTQQKEVIAIFNKEGNYKKTNLHFNKSVDILDIEASPIDSSLIFAGSNQGLFVSKDSGLNWYNFSDVEHKINSDAKVYKIAFNPNKTTEEFISVFYGNKGTIYKSRDNFFSLEKIFEINNEAVYDFDIDGSNLYLGLSNGRLLLHSLEKNGNRVLTSFNSPISQLKVFGYTGLIYLTLKSGGFWVSANFGQSFERMKFLDNYAGANKINHFESSIINNALIYAATDYGLIRSLNSGESWQVFKSLPTEESSISALAFEENKNEIFAASNGKIYTSFDNGLSWQITDTGISGRIISIIKPIGDKIVVGTKRS